MNKAEPSLADEMFFDSFHVIKGFWHIGKEEHLKDTTAT